MVHEIAHSLPLFMQQMELIISSGDNWKYYGAEVLMDVYSISGVKQDQDSIGQVMLSKGENGPSDFINPIHFGWGVSFLLGLKIK